VESGRAIAAGQMRRAEPTSILDNSSRNPGLFSVPPVVPISEPLPLQTPIPVARRTFAELLVRQFRFIERVFSNSLA